MNKFLDNFYKSQGFYKNLIDLRYYIFGYKIKIPQYASLNQIITTVVYAIYKTYYISEQKTKNINPLDIFKCEIRKMYETLIYQKINPPTLLENIHKLC